MSERHQITSFSNPRVKFCASLKEKKNRHKEGLVFIEGYREISRALQGGVRFDSLFVSPSLFLGANEEELIQKAGVITFELPRKNFEKISMRDRPDGLIAVAGTPDVHWKPQNLSGDFFIVIEGVEKPGNLGTIIRTAEGAGVSAVIVADPKTDIFNPNVIRASTGAVFTMPVMIGSIEDVFHWFHSKGIQILCVTPEATRYYFEADLKKPTALVFGSEQYGLGKFARSNPELFIGIPMRGQADSLNLAMSCGILSYDVIRQRMS